MENNEKNTDMMEYGAGDGGNADLQPVPEEPEKKKKFSQKVAEFLLSEDYKLVTKDIYDRMILPVAKSLAVDIFKAIIYHGKPQSDGPYTVNEYTRYDRIYEGGSMYGSESKLPSRYRFRDIYYRSPEDAEQVLAALKAMLRRQKVVTIADYYQIAHKTPDPGYYDFGWTDLSSAKVYGVDGKEGRMYAIRFPNVIPMSR